MHLKRIELRGFKSFAGLTDIKLAPGITGVVGPNGSGKSNIVDALRWVLGEQSSKNLRGTSMQDVIFKGTQRRPAKNSCQVSLVFDNTDGRLHSDYSEVAVTRSVSRTGDSEYRLNGNLVRLKDILSLFRDTGIGKDGYSIVGQGRVNQILEDKASERRAVFEEAAGVMKYRVSKEEAERNLEKAKINTDRVRDILSELQSQAEPAKEESERAKTYLALSDELKRLEIGAILWDYDQACTRQKSAEEKLEAIAQKEREHAKKVEAAGSETLEVKEKHERAQALLKAVTARKAACERDTEKEKGTCALQEQRLADARGRIEKAAKGIAERDAERRQTQATLVSARQESDALSAQADAEDAKIEPLRQELSVLVQTSKAEGTFGGEDSASLRQRASDESAKAKAYELEQQNVKKRLEELSEDAASAQERAQSAQTAVQQAEREYAQKKTRFEELALQVLDLQSRDRAFAEQTSQLSGELQRMERDAAAAKAQADVMQGALSAHQGYYDSVRQLMRDASANPSLGQHLIGVVGDCVKVSKEHETAVEIALGAGVQNVIVRTDEDAKVLVAHLRQKRYGRVTFLPSSALRISRLNGMERNTLREEGVLCVASDAVECEPDVRPAVEYLLARTVIVRDLDTALRLKRENRNTFRIVTSAGEVVSQGGAITGGDVKKNQKGFLSRQRAAETAQGRAQALERQRADAQNRLLEAQDAQKKAQAELSAVLAEHGAARTEMQSAQLEWEHLTQRERDASEASSKRASERELLEKQMQDLQAAALASSQEAASLRLRLEAAERVEHEAAEEKTQRALKEADLRTKIAQMEAEAGKIASQAQMKLAEVAHLESADIRLQSEIEELTTEKNAMQVVQKEAQEVLEGATARLKTAQERGSEADGEIERLTRDVAQMSEAEAAALSTANELEQEERELFQQRFAANSEQERSKEAQNELLDRLWAEYELTLGNAAPYRDQAVSRRKAGVRIGEIREKIREMGVVNPRAPEDYENLMARIDDLSAQEADLVKAEDDLKTVIDELLKGMRDIFTQKFSQINENFQTTFTSLFGGGSACLELESGVDVMDAGIEIKAEPPGKKVQSLALMSGGERALTAIALIFAMLNVNPSPVCLLDEIDAPLDDKNVERLSAYLDSLSDRLQFIVITHKKTTMAACDALYGVTMPEKGVSQIVSVQLTEGDI